MSSIRLTSNNKQNGKVVYNTGIVQNIVALAVAEVEGVIPHKVKRAAFRCTLKKTAYMWIFPLLLNTGIMYPI